MELSSYNDRNYYSDTTDISIGVPQGSVLGPLLFIVYMNDVQSCLKKSEAILFADDTTILCSNKDFDILYHEIEIDLANLIDWFNANKLSLNIEKTNYILFKAKNSNFSAKRELSIVNKVINNVTQTKFLGLYIDYKLSWNKHINNLITKLIKNTYLINTSKRLIPGWAKCSLYNAHIKSHISYGILLWGPMCTKRNIDKLFKIQKKNIRSITNSKYNAHSNPLFYETKLLKIQDIIEVELARFSYQYQHSALPNSLKNLFRSNESMHQYNTRQKRLPRIEKHTRAIFNKSFLNKSIINWSMIKQDIKNLKTLDNFTRKLSMDKINNYA